MNTTVEVQGAPVAPVQAWFAQVEQELSRFDPDSALSQLNRLPGHWTVASPLLYEAIHHALIIAAATDGAFDPTVLAALEASGYSRSFEQGQTPPRAPQPAERWSAVRLDPAWRSICLPLGVRLDLGGIGKGFAVDGAMRQLADAPRLLINAGGDLSVRTAPGDAPVQVEIADPFDLSRTLATVALAHGAMATSSTRGRRWGAGLHHIIDPRTGHPANTGIAAVTVVAGTVTRAETLAKACIVLGVDRGVRLLENGGCPGLLVTDEGEVLTTAGWEGALHVGS